MKGDLLWCSGEAVVRWGSDIVENAQMGRCFWCCGVIPTVGA